MINISRNPLIYVVGLVALADATFWWLASRTLDHPQVSAALIGAASGLLVATIGILSAILGSKKALENNLVMFERQMEAERGARFMDDKRKACGSLLTWATAYLTARDRTDKERQNFEEIKAQFRAGGPQAPLEDQVVAASQRVEQAVGAEKSLLEQVTEARWSLALLAPSMETDLSRLLEVFADGSHEELEECRKQLLLAARRELDVTVVGVAG